MRTRRSRRAARYAWLTAVLTAVFGMVGGVLAMPAYAADDAVVVITHNRLEGTRNVPLDLTNFGPGDTEQISVLVRNDTNRFVSVTYTETNFRNDSLAEYVELAFKHDGYEFARGRADSDKLAGATFDIAPRTATRLQVELHMQQGEGNEAQGTSMRVAFRFEIAGGHAKIGTGSSIGRPNATGVAGRDSTQTGTTAPARGVLPSTGESLEAFHLLVWAALGVFAGLLVVLTVAAARRRHMEQVRPVTIFDDVPTETRGGRR